MQLCQQSLDKMWSRKVKTVEKTAIVELIISSLYSLFICVIMWCFSKELLSIFTNDAQTLLVGANYFKGHCWDYVIVMPLATPFWYIYRFRSYFLCGCWKHSRGISFKNTSCLFPFEYIRMGDIGNRDSLSN